MIVRLGVTSDSVRYVQSGLSRRDFIGSTKYIVYKLTTLPVQVLQRRLYRKRQE